MKIVIDINGEEVKVTKVEEKKQEVSESTTLVNREGSGRNPGVFLFLNVVKNLLT